MAVALPHGVVVVGGVGVVVVFTMASVEFESVCELEIMSIMNCFLVFAATFHQ